MEIKVKKYCEENDDYVELWKVIGAQKGMPRFFGRYTYGDQGIWYYISDPLGYCEMDHQVADDVMFILCDESGNECCRYSNADDNPLPKLDTVITQEYEKISDKLDQHAKDADIDKLQLWMETQATTILPTHRWLLTFKDPDKYGKEIAEMNGYDENWTGGMHCREVSYEPIPDTEFEYLGKKYQFTKIVNKHEICGAEWSEFVCTDSPYVVKESPFRKGEKYIRCYKLMSSWHEEESGPMYDRHTALRNIRDSLLDTMGKNGYTGRRILYVEGNYCYEKYYEQVAEEMAISDLHKETINELCSHMDQICGTTVFPCNKEGKEKVKEMYPGIYGYNWCLI